MLTLPLFFTTTFEVVAGLCLTFMFYFSISWLELSSEVSLSMSYALIAWLLYRLLAPLVTNYTKHYKFFYPTLSPVSQTPNLFSLALLHFGIGLVLDFFLPKVFTLSYGGVAFTAVYIAYIIRQNNHRPYWHFLVWFFWLSPFIAWGASVVFRVEYHALVGYLLLTYALVSLQLLFLTSVGEMWRREAS